MSSLFVDFDLSCFWESSDHATREYMDAPCTPSLCGELGSRFYIEEWGCPEIGVYFADCPSAGHDMLCLDYRACGPQGEPTVVHVDQELDYAITAVAPDFETFVRGLEGSSSDPRLP